VEIDKIDEILFYLLFPWNDTAGQYTRGEVVVYPTITSGAVGLSG
jgi:hypothetical protein